jgi:hypothetical protein
MKRLVVLVAALALMVGLTLTGCGRLGFMSGTGAIVNKTYDNQDFKGVEASANFTVEISQANYYSVVVSTHENIIGYLNVVQSGDVLKLGLQSGSYTNTDLKAVITMPQLDDLNLSGASRADVNGFQSGNDFNLTASGASQAAIDIKTGITQLEISGASRVTGQLQARSFALNLSGASRCELTGSAGASNLEVTGASHAVLPEFPAGTVDVRVSGASGAIINTTGTLNLDVSGASSLDYYGNPALGKVSVTGASKINSKG